jgi:hypothetical protein
MTFFVPLGGDCSPAATLQGLGLRVFALPFNWTSEDAEQIIDCLKDDFANFHKNLTVVKGAFENSIVVDHYGIMFRHDYPTVENNATVSNDDGIYPEHRIVDNWIDYYPDVYAKYVRRIERFRNVFRGDEDIVIITRYPVWQCLNIQKALLELYGKTFRFVTATPERSTIPSIIACNPEKDGNWNDGAIWKQYL